MNGFVPLLGSSGEPLVGENDIPLKDEQKQFVYFDNHWKEIASRYRDGGKGFMFLSLLHDVDFLIEPSGRGLEGLSWFGRHHYFRTNEPEEPRCPKGYFAHDPFFLPLVPMNSTKEESTIYQNNLETYQSVKAKLMKKFKRPHWVVFYVENENEKECHNSCGRINDGYLYLLEKFPEKRRSAVFDIVGTGWDWPLFVPTQTSPMCEPGPKGSNKRPLEFVELREKVTIELKGQRLEETATREEESRDEGVGGGEKVEEEKEEVKQSKREEVIEIPEETDESEQNSKNSREENDSGGDAAVEDMKVILEDSKSSSEGEDEENIQQLNDQQGEGGGEFLQRLMERVKQLEKELKKQDLEKGSQIDQLKKQDLEKGSQIEQLEKELKKQEKELKDLKSPPKLSLMNKFLEVGNLLCEGDMGKFEEQKNCLVDDWVELTKTMMTDLKHCVADSASGGVLTDAGVKPLSIQRVYLPCHSLNQTDIEKVKADMGKVQGVGQKDDESLTRTFVPGKLGLRGAEYLYTEIKYVKFKVSWQPSDEFDKKSTVECFSRVADETENTRDVESVRRSVLLGPNFFDECVLVLTGVDSGYEEEGEDPNSVFDLKMFCKEEVKRKFGSSYVSNMRTIVSNALEDKNVLKARCRINDLRRAHTARRFYVLPRIRHVSNGSKKNELHFDPGFPKSTEPESDVFSMVDTAYEAGMKLLSSQVDRAEGLRVLFGNRKYDPLHRTDLPPGMKVGRVYVKSGFSLRIGDCRYNQFGMKGFLDRFVTVCVGRKLLHKDEEGGVVLKREDDSDQETETSTATDDEDEETELELKEDNEENEVFNYSYMFMYKKQKKCCGCLCKAKGGKIPDEIKQLADLNALNKCCTIM